MNDDDGDIIQSRSTFRGDQTRTHGRPPRQRVNLIRLYERGNRETEE